VKAALLHGLEDLRVEDVDEPRAGAGEVVLDIRAATSCGTDVKMYRRGHRILAEYPARFGHEFAGVVAEVGDGVDTFAVGDEVFCANSAPCGACAQCARGNLTLCEELLFLLGGFGERLLVPERIVRRNLHWLPPGLPMELAPLAEPLACAVRAVEVARIEAGERVAIVGAGSLGRMLSILVARAGAEPILLDRRAERLGDAQGADQSFEAVGSPETWEFAVSLVRPGGAVNLFGGCAAGTTFTVPTERIHYEEVTLRGTFHHTPTHIRTALELLAEDPERWQELRGPQISLGELEPALRGELGSSSKYLVVPG
jgi:L-iditol 2-dehydrogenase